MAKPRNIAALMIALTIAATLLTPIVGIVGSNTGEQTVTNETVTASTSDYVDLEGYTLETGSETVYYPNGSGSYAEAHGSDYTMNYTAGSILATQGGNITDGDQIKVSYTYQATGSTTTTVVGLVPLFVALLMLVTIAVRVSDAI